MRFYDRCLSGDSYMQDNDCKKHKHCHVTNACHVNSKKKITLDDIANITTSVYHIMECDFF